MIRDEFIALQDIEEKIYELRATFCSYDCEDCDNGVECRKDCPILRQIRELYVKSDNLINQLN